MGSNLVGNTLSLLAGASLGAIATYLLDPEQGDRRRQLIADRAEKAMAGTGDMVNSHLHRAAESAKHIAGKLSEYAEAAADHVSDHVGHAAGHVAGHAQMLADHAQSVRDELAGRANSIYSDARRAARRRAGLESSHPIAQTAGITAGAVGIAAVGAGVMFFMDPAKGRARRAWVVDKTWSWTRKTGQSARSYGRHLGNQLKGVAHEVQRVMPENWSHAAAQASDAMTDGVKSAVNSSGQ